MISFAATLKAHKDAVFLGAVFGRKSPEDIVENINDLRICENFGWSWEYVRDMDLETRAIVLGMMEGDNTLRKYKENKRGKGGF